MEFWGVEVKPGEPLQIKPDVSKLIHISQAAVGEVKNGKGPKKVHLRLKIDGKMYIIGTLSAEDRPQILFDLVLHKEFELSHDWKEGNIYLAGYIADDESCFSDDDEDGQVDTLRNGNFGPVKPPTEKTALAKSNPSEKPMSKDEKLKKDKVTSDVHGDDSDVGEDSDDDDDNSEMEEDSDALEHLMYGDDSDDDDESDEDDKQDLVSQKKMPSETAIESPVPAAKKTKLAASQKSGGKTPPINGKLKEHNPKSGGQRSSKSNSKALNTNNALHPCQKSQARP